MIMITNIIDDSNMRSEGGAGQQWEPAAWRASIDSSLSAMHQHIYIYIYIYVSMIYIYIYIYTYKCVYIYTHLSLSLYI